MSKSNKLCTGSVGSIGHRNYFEAVIFVPSAQLTNYYVSTVRKFSSTICRTSPEGSFPMQTSPELGAVQ